MENQPRGFIALMSVLIISAVLFLIATGGSFSGFYGRLNSLGFENKKRTEALAEACVSQTLLGLANDPAYISSGTTTVSGAGTCTTKMIFNDPKTGSYIFRTRSYEDLTHTYTNLEIVVNSTDITLQSVSEIPNF